MNAQQAENLRILIRHMETNVQRTLDMRWISSNCSQENPCGTPACAWGEACMVPELHAELGTLETRKTLGIFPCFGEYAACRLFGTRLNDKTDVSPKEWAQVARAILAKCGYTMEEPEDGFAAFRAKILAPLTEDVPCWPEF